MTEYKILKRRKKNNPLHVSETSAQEKHWAISVVYMFFSTLQYARNLLKEKQAISKSKRKSFRNAEKNKQLEAFLGEIEETRNEVCHEINEWLEQSVLDNELKEICQQYYINGESHSSIQSRHSSRQNFEREIKGALGYGY